MGQEPTAGEMFSATVLFPDGDTAGCKAVFSSDANWKKLKDIQMHRIISMQESTKLVRTSQFGRKLTKART